MGEMQTIMFCRRLCSEFWYVHWTWLHGKSSPRAFAVTGSLCIFWQPWQLDPQVLQDMHTNDCTDAACEWGMDTSSGVLQEWACKSQESGSVQEHFQRCQAFRSSDTWPDFTSSQHSFEAWIQLQEFCLWSSSKVQS